MLNHREEIRKAEDFLEAHESNGGVFTPETLGAATSLRSGIFVSLVNEEDERFELDERGKERGEKLQPLLKDLDLYSVVFGVDGTPAGVHAVHRFLGGSYRPDLVIPDANELPQGNVRTLIFHRLNADVVVVADAPENGEITESTVMRWEVRDAMISALNRSVPLARTGKLSAILAAAARD